MLDKHIVPLLKPPLQRTARRLHASGIVADQVTTIGFIAGLGAVVFVALNQPLAGLVALLLNRLADGIDGELARLQQPTDAGAFLDITLDFIFYALFPVGFALSNPAANALPAAVLVASFVGTGASFLAFSSMADKRGISHPNFGYKGLYYLNGLAEGTETIIVFVLMCLLPAHFPLLAWLFAAICLVTTVNRVVFGYRTLRD
jgi:phosphatidylglycerophosphate synthase